MANDQNVSTTVSEASQLRLDVMTLFEKCAFQLCTYFYLNLKFKIRKNIQSMFLVRFSSNLFLMR